MSLFIALLAFGESRSVNAAKLGILAGSLAGIIAAIILKTTARKRI